jgi:NADH-quinone oxidoreductase subunit L
MLELIWLIPLLPLIGVLINGFFGRRMSLKAVGYLACGVVLAAFLIGAGAIWQLVQMPADSRQFETEIGAWLPLGTLMGAGHEVNISWGFNLDALSAVMLMVVAGVGFLIHVYSIGYMEHEKDYARFFVYLNLFMAMMLMLVLGNSLLVLFVGWEGVGLCSYLLIGFFYDKPFDKRTGLTCADAGRKAFIVNRIGDFAFLVGMLYLVLEFGTLKYSELIPMLQHGHAAPALLTGIGILLFIGACGKSAQIPLYVWLPDAMAGPTPVSALIHAATMVTAGVYMVCRMSALFSASTDAMAIVATVGALTAIFAATMGITATDIKKVLAYSTVSQLGFMFAAAGVGAYIAAIFHLMTHAFFKALLFLGAGSVIHGMSGEQDIRKMGGLKSKMPSTHWTFLVAMLAIAGIPVFAGFFSKDEILAGAWFGGHKGVWAVLAAAAVITAFYMMRLYYLVFRGKFRGTKDQWSHAHESTRWMTVPLMILAVLAIVGGWIGIPQVLAFGADINVFHHWLEPAITMTGGGHGAAEHGAEVAHHSVGVEWTLIAVAIGAAIFGLWLALSIYRQEGRAEAIAKRSGPIYTLLRNLYWVDELYEAVAIKPFYTLSRWFRTFDRWVVDGLVNASGITADIAGQVIKLFQTGLVRNYALMFLLGVIAILFYLVTI